MDEYQPRETLVGRLLERGPPNILTSELEESGSGK